MRDLDLLDRVVACTRYCADVCPEIADGSKAIVSDSWSAQANQILDTKPELVIASVPYQMESVAEILKAGIRFLGLAPRTMTDIYNDILTIASIMGVPGDGERVVHQMQEAIERIRLECADGSPKVRVFCEEWGKPIIASQPWVAELVAYANGEFLGDPGKQIASENVLSARPDALIAAWCGAGDRVPLEKIIEQRGWKDTPAARSSRVFCISDELLNTPATSLVRGLQAIAWALHPGQFSQPTGIRQIRPD